MKALAVSARTLSSPAAIESIAAEWRALEAATPEATGFQSAAWRLCCSTGAAAPRIVVVRENSRLVMLLPLQVEELWGFTIARWLGEPLAQYGDALALPDPRRPFWYSAAEAEMARWKDVDLLALARLRTDSVIASCGVKLVMATAAKNRAPFIDLGKESMRRHKSVERRLKKLHRYGPLRFEIAQGPAQRREAAEQALSLKREWLRRRRRFGASLSNPAVGESVLALAEKGVLRAHRLWAGERLVSVELGLKSGAAYRSLIGAYDDDLAEASPGHALTLHMLRNFEEEGVTRVDFLPPADPYKMLFATGVASMGAHYAPYNWRGAASAFALARLRPLVKTASLTLADAGLAMETLFRRFASFLSDARRGAGKSAQESLTSAGAYRRD